MLQEDDYEAAGALAFELGQPGQLLRVVEAATTKGPEAAQKILGKLVAGLGGDQIRQCLEFVREWNTNSRRCHAAQATLQAILLQHSPEVEALRNLYFFSCSRLPSNVAVVPCKAQKSTVHSIFIRLSVIASMPLSDLPWFD